MALSNYSELQAAVESWLDRSDTPVTDFIRLAELDIARQLRKRVLVGSVTTTTDARTADLPADFGEPRVLAYNESSLVGPLKMTTMANLLQLAQTGSGSPSKYAIYGSTVMFDITPDTSRDLFLVYEEALTALSDSNPTNPTLTACPDVYLFAALREAELFLEHEERAAVWDAKYQRALQDENNQRERAELAGGPVVMGLPTVFD